MPLEATDKIALDARAHLSIVDSGGLVFSETTQEIYALNTLATFVWCCAEEDMSVPDTAHRIARSFGFSPDKAATEVAALLGQWRGLGLMAGRDGEEARIPPRKAEEKYPVPTGMPHWVQPIVVAERRYRLLTTVVTVRFTNVEQEAWVHPVLAQFETQESSHAVSVIDMIEVDGHHLIYSDKEPRARCEDLDTIAPWVKSLVWQSAIDHYDYFLQIHAGVVGAGDHCILLPGAPGNGKSTLTSALSHAGFDYYSDEVALLEYPGFVVRPLPLSIGVKSTGWDVLAPYMPELRDLPIHRRADGKVLRYVPPPVPDIHADRDTGCRVGQIIFPCYAPDADTRLEPLGRVAALKRLMDECLAIPGRLTVDNVAGLARWIKSVNCYELPLSSLDEAVALVRGIASPSRTGSDDSALVDSTRT
ncbi:MAG: PqqD family peptide modification chaperone [Rhodospirillaceae bacterium]|jgi:hypothetical protein|nr:PqqD family peptide modification chaperone [Rhodospirillaceae bacterium]MBT5455169.1 PqqD family peptide modification chaperone [Rhodospirillaceae bacterium]